LCSATLALLGVEFLRQPDLDQRLIPHVALVGGDLDAIEQALRQAQRNGGGGQLQVAEPRPLRLAPIDLVGRIVGLPKLPFLRLATKAGDRPSV
jgi:hypothetical protein